MADTTSAGTVSPAHQPEPTLLGLEAETWVYISVAIFLLLAVFVGKLPQRIVAALDARIADARQALEQAKAVRAEAEALLAGARRQQEAAASDARAIIDQAHAEATQMLADAQAGADATIGRRIRMAEDKIAAAERNAEAGLRAQAVELATGQARVALAQQADAGLQAHLADAAIAELGRI